MDMRIPASIHTLGDHVAARSKAWICDSSLVGIVGSKPPGAWRFVSCDCCVLSGTGICVRLITSPEESTECDV